MATVAATRRPRGSDPVHEYAIHVCLALLYAACTANGIVPSERLLRLLMRIICHGPSVASLGAVAQCEPRAVAVVVQVAASMRTARQTSAIALSREVTERQYAALRARYGVLLTKWEACLVACTRCKKPHSIQSQDGVAAQDGYVDVRCDVIGGRFECKKIWHVGEPARLYPLQLLGHIVLVGRTEAYTICCTCGNRAVVDVDAVGYSAEACFNCRVETTASERRRGPGRGKGRRRTDESEELPPARHGRRPLLQDDSKLL